MTTHLFRQLLLIVISWSFCGSTCTPSPLSCTSANFPKPDHIVIVILENKNFDQVYDTSAAPFIQSLIRDTIHTAVFTDSRAMGHPSQPNYFWLFSGDDQGITTNDRPAAYFNTPNLAAGLLHEGHTFLTYSEGLPYAGYDGDQFGQYVRKHNPVACWAGKDQYQVDATLSVPFTDFPVDFAQLPTISYVVPDLINGMHDGSVTQGDAWLKTHMETFIQYAKTHSALFVLTFDETGYEVTDNRILTLLIGRDVQGGHYDTPVSHINWLRTWEAMYDLPEAGMADILPVIDWWKTE